MDTLDNFLNNQKILQKLIDDAGLKGKCINKQSIIETTRLPTDEINQHIQLLITDGYITEAVKDGTYCTRDAVRKLTDLLTTAAR